MYTVLKCIHTVCRRKPIQGLNLNFRSISGLETEMPVTVCAMRNSCMLAPCLCYFCVCVCVCVSLSLSLSLSFYIRVASKPPKKEESCLLPILNKYVNMWTIMLVMIKVGSSQWRIYCWYKYVLCKNQITMSETPIFE